MQLVLIIRMCCVSPSFPMHLFGVVLKIKDGFTFDTLHSFPYICVHMPICMHCVCVCKCNKKLGVPYFIAQFTMFVDYCFFLLLSMSTNIWPNCTNFRSADMKFEVNLTFILLTFWQHGRCRNLRASHNTGSSKKMDGIWNRYNLKSTGRIYTFGVLKCSEKFKVLDLP